MRILISRLFAFAVSASRAAQIETTTTENGVLTGWTLTSISDAGLMRMTPA